MGPEIGLRHRIEEGHREKPFLCDASLGGLARWLRGAGYGALCPAGARGQRLVEDAARRGLVLLTSDHRVLERRGVRTGQPRVILIPSRLRPVEQLAMVLHELDLPLREPLCMACGGALTPVPRTDVEERIPPRTALWKDEYFLCDGCGKLFWRGTHWERIHHRLADAAGPS